jgi:hypothetical protein
MPKTKRGINPLIASYRRLLIEQLIAEETAKGKVKMTIVTNAKIRLSYGSVPVEIELMGDENGLSVQEIKSEVDTFIMNGFTPPVSWLKDKMDFIGKKGTVISITPVAGTKMYEVMGGLDDGGTEFKWRVFSLTTFRKNDRFIIVKNDRGFKEGELIIDDEQMELPL